MTKKKLPTTITVKVLKANIELEISDLREYKNSIARMRNYQLCANIDGRIDELNALLHWVKQGNYLIRLTGLINGW